MYDIIRTKPDKKKLRQNIATVRIAFSELSHLML